MSVADLMEAMMAAGAPMDAILLAVRALEGKDAEIEARRAGDRERKRRQRDASRDSHGTVTGNGAEPLILEVSPQTPLPNPDLDIPPYSPPKSENLNGHHAEPAAPALLPEHVVDFWNENAAAYGLPTASLTPRRRKALQSRIRQHGVEDWTEAIGAIQRSPFLRGENDRGWRANIDFLLRADSITKLKEGVYDGSAH